MRKVITSVSYFGREKIYLVIAAQRLSLFQNYLFQHNFSLTVKKIRWSSKESIRQRKLFKTI